MKKNIYLFSGLLLAGLTSNAQVSFQNRSHSPTFVNISTANFPGVQAFSLVGSADTLPQSTTFRFGGSADGAGILKNSNGTYTYLLNHEDNFSVSRITLDNTFKPVKGEYLLNSNGGMWRLCSATMATPQTHGFGPLFLTCGETSVESMTHYLNPYGPAITDSTTSANTTLASGLGKWNAENALPLPLATYPGQTIILIGDDDSGTNGGQVVMYKSNGVGNLNSGTLYVLRRVDQNQRERDVPVGTFVNVEFVAIPNYMTMTGAQLDTYSNTTLKSIKFQRVEDLDYRKGSPNAARQIFFNATGQVNSDTTDRTLWGRVYELQLDSLNPLTGKLRCILNGDDKNPANAARVLYQPDNICVTEDYVYIQEDPNGYVFPSSAPYVHDANIYQYDIQTAGFKQLLGLDHHRGLPYLDSAIYNQNATGTGYARSGTGSWEFGAMVAVSAETGVDHAFVLSLQPHSWRSPVFAGVDGGTKRATENQGSLLITLTGVPRVKAQAPVVSSAMICAGSPAVLKASQGSTYASTNGTTYKWYTVASGGAPVFTGPTFTTPFLNANATYYVESFISGNASPARTAVTVTVTAAPAQPTITQNGNTLVSSATTGNQWYRNGVLLTGGTSQTLTINQSGYYSVSARTGTCVSPVSNDVLVSITGIEEISALDEMNIFPNPNDGTFVINFNTREASERLHVRIVNALGQIVYEDTAEKFNGNYSKKVQLNDNAAGVYHVTLYTDTKAYKKTISKH